MNGVSERIQGATEWRIRNAVVCDQKDAPSQIVAGRKHKSENAGQRQECDCDLRQKVRADQVNPSLQ